MCTVICQYSSCPSIGSLSERRISNEFQVSKLFSLTLNLPTKLKILIIFWSHLFISFITHVTITNRHSSLNGSSIQRAVGIVISFDHVIAIDWMTKSCTTFLTNEDRQIRFARTGFPALYAVFLQALTLRSHWLI